MKKYFYLIIFLLIVIFVKPSFAGNDVTITCNSNKCSQDPILPLFSETNIYPGFTATQKLIIDNKRSLSCDLYFEGVSGNSQSLADKIVLNIIGDDNNYSLSNYSLADLINPNTGNIYLGEIAKNTKTSYTWSATLSQDANNDYVDKTTDFSINFNFSCGKEAPSSPTTNPSSSSQVSGASVASAPQCTNSYPSAPSNLSASPSPDGSVALSWTHTISDHTGYLIAFGNSPGNYLYGAPDVGNVTNYTVRSLTPGAQYCFYVRSLNGCMPGDRTPEVCINSGSTVIPSTIIPEDFEPEILGVESTQEETPKITSYPDSTQLDNKVLGESVSICQKQSLPLLFLVAFIVNFVLVWRFSPRWSVLFLISLVSFVLDYFLSKDSCCYGQKWACYLFWLGPIFSFVIPLSLKDKISQK